MDIKIRTWDIVVKRDRHDCRVREQRVSNFLSPWCLMYNTTVVMSHITISITWYLLWSLNPAEQNMSTFGWQIGTIIYHQNVSTECFIVYLIYKLWIYVCKGKTHVTVEEIVPALSLQLLHSKVNIYERAKFINSSLAPILKHDCSFFTAAIAIPGHEKVKHVKVCWQISRFTVFGSVPEVRN